MRFLIVTLFAALFLASCVGSSKSSSKKFGALKNMGFELGADGAQSVLRGKKGDSLSSVTARTKFGVARYEYGSYAGFILERSEYKPTGSLASSNFFNNIDKEMKARSFGTYFGAHYKGFKLNFEASRGKFHLKPTVMDNVDAAHSDGEFDMDRLDAGIEYQFGYAGAGALNFGAAATTLKLHRGDLCVSESMTCGDHFGSRGSEYLTGVTSYIGFRAQNVLILLGLYFGLESEQYP